MNLFRHTEGELGGEDLAAEQAFADIATIGLMNRRVADEAAIVNRQLSEALESRVLIEQAKGMVAERTGSSIEAAFDRLRHHARSNNRRLTDVASDVVVGVLAPLNLARLPRE